METLPGHAWAGEMLRVVSLLVEQHQHCLFPLYCPLYTCKRRYLTRRCSDRDLPAPGETFLGPAFGWSSQLPPLVSICWPLLLAPRGYSRELGLLAGLFRRCKNDRFKKEMENAAGNGLCLSLELANTSRAWIACATCNVLT